MQCLKCPNEAQSDNALCAQCWNDHNQGISSAQAEHSERRARPVASRTRHAGFLRRMLAFWIDALVVVLLQTIILAVASFLGLAVFAARSRVGTASSLEFTLVMGFIPIILGFAAVVLCGFLYFGIMEGIKTGATLGKQLFKIRVVTLDREGLTLLHSFGHSLARFTPSLVLLLGVLLSVLAQSSAIFFLGVIACLILGLIQYPMMFFNDSQTLHDRIAGTHVIRTGELTQSELYMRGALSIIAAILVFVVSYVSQGKSKDTSLQGSNSKFQFHYSSR